MNPLAPLLESLRRALRDEPQAPRLREIPRGAALDGTQLLEAVAAQAAALKRAGVGPGDRVLLYCAHGASFPVGVLACWEAGACCILAEGGTPAEGIERLSRTFAPAAILGDHGAGDIRGRRSPLRCQPPRAGCRGGPEPIPEAAVIKLTSGTTDAPRGVVVTAPQLLAGASHILETMEIRPHDVNIGAISMAHSYGFDNLVMPLVAQGSPLAIASLASPDHLAAALSLSEPSVFPGVPYLFDLLCRAPAPWRPVGLRLCISAGAPLPARVAAAFRDRCGLGVRTFYGTTETGGISFDRSPDADLPEGCVGTPLSGVRVEICPLSDDLGAGVGRVAVRSAAVAHSYLPAEPGGEGPGDGRFATGDLGRLDAEGRLHLAGRLDHVVNVGGRKVNPVEVERALRSVPLVRDAVVVAVADRHRGQTLAACVEAGPGPTRESILESLSDLLPRHKLPRRLVLVAELPHTPRGKPDLDRIRDLLQAS